MGSVEPLDNWLRLPPVPGAQTSAESPLLLLKLSHQHEPLLRQTLAAARNPGIEDAASLADKLSFLDRFLNEQEFANDERAVTLQQKLDAAWNNGHPEAQDSTLRATYQATTRGNIEHWRDELFKARERLFTPPRAERGPSTESASHGNRGDDIKLPPDAFRNAEGYDGTPQPPPIHVESQDEALLWEQALDAAVNPDAYTLEQLTASRAFLGNARERSYADDAEWHRLLDEEAQLFRDHSWSPARGDAIKARLLSTTRGYLEARWYDLLTVTQERGRESRTPAA
jgi:hypothetical protein